MVKTFWVKILFIDASTWKNRQSLDFAKVLVLKLASLLGTVILFFKVLLALGSPEASATITIIQLVLLATLVAIHLSCRNARTGRRGNQLLLLCLSVGLIASLLTSPSQGLSGSYHFVTTIMLFAGFQLGVRYVIGLFGVFSVLYLGLAFGLIPHSGNSLLSPPVLIRLYVDRIIELAIVTLFVGLYHRLKERQYKIIAEHERQSSHKEKLLSISRMAGGIAHEINNPLAIVMGYVEIMSNNDGQKPLDRRVFPRIIQACERISAIVKSILELSRDEEDRLESIDLLKSCQLHIEHIMDSTRLNHVKYSLELDPLQFQVTGGNWDLILKAILQNAFEAVESQSLPQVTVSWEQHEAYFNLLIADNGPAFDETAIGNFFEPFYTSKSDSHGRGMGLTIAHVLATRLGWNIQFRREGTWTKVHLKIPYSSIHIQTIFAEAS